VCAALDHAATRAAVTAERGVLASLGGGCQVPIGAHASVTGTGMRLVGMVISPDGSRMVREEIEGAACDAYRLGRELGDTLLDRGARQILEEVYAAPARDSDV
jgi:hydroxymethylbilane synthase